MTLSHLNRLLEEYLEFTDLLIEAYSVHKTLLFVKMAETLQRRLHMHVEELQQYASDVASETSEREQALRYLRAIADKLSSYCRENTLFEKICREIETLEKTLA